MYQTDFICTYKGIKLHDEPCEAEPSEAEPCEAEQEPSEAEQEPCDMQELDMQEWLYRIQLLQAFDLTEWNDDAINDTIMTVFKQVYLIPEFVALLEKARRTPAIKALLDILCPEHDQQEKDLTKTMVLFNQSQGQAQGQGQGQDQDQDQDQAQAQGLQNLYHLTVFKLLFKYEYFDVLHYCLGVMLRTGVLPPRYIEMFLKELQQ